jgi:predicted Zn-dependent protease with MMP-like domain
MDRARFVQITAEALDSLPQEFRQRLRNVAVLVEDYPQGQGPRDRTGRPRKLPPAPGRLLLGIYVGVPLTQRSVFNIPTGPDHIVLYQKNIEAVCRGEQEIREQIRRTVIHEVGHYFGLDEEQLKDV